MACLLEVKGLKVCFDIPDGEVGAVNGVDFHLNEGETLGVVGESGSGKTQIFLSIMGLLSKNGRAEGSVLFNGQEILGLPAKRLNTIRGVQMSMIFQDPMTALNPFLTIGRQMNEVLIEHSGYDRARATRRAVELLDLVGIPEPAKRHKMYPHEFSGGMRQRVMIAMALLCDPKLLIADEPTTALDVTVQAQILELLQDLKKNLNTAIVMITHDLGVVAGLCDRMMVMYGGRTVERGPTDDLFHDPTHPYTVGLLEAMPRIDGQRTDRLHAIPGQPPDLQRLPIGCAYAPRCDRVFERCHAQRPALRDLPWGDRARACHREHPV